jgi:hypothetical protein
MPLLNGDAPGPKEDLFSLDRGAIFWRLVLTKRLRPK